jgi:hypothetical protein
MALACADQVLPQFQQPTVGQQALIVPLLPHVPGMAVSREAGMEAVSRAQHAAATGFSGSAAPGTLAAVRVDPQPGGEATQPLRRQTTVFNSSLALGADSPGLLKLPVRESGAFDSKAAWLSVPLPSVALGTPGYSSLHSRGSSLALGRVPFLGDHDVRPISVMRTAESTAALERCQVAAMTILLHGLEALGTPLQCSPLRAAPAAQPVVAAKAVPASAAAKAAAKTKTVKPAPSPPTSPMRTLNIINCACDAVMRLLGTRAVHMVPVGRSSNMQPAPGWREPERDLFFNTLCLRLQLGYIDDANHGRSRRMPDDLPRELPLLHHPLTYMDSLAGSAGRTGLAGVSTTAVQVPIGGSCAIGTSTSTNVALLSPQELQRLFITDVKEFLRARAVQASKLRHRAYYILQTVLHANPTVEVSSALIQKCVLVGTVSTGSGVCAYGAFPASAMVNSASRLSTKVNFPDNCPVLAAYRAEFQQHSSWDVELPSGCTDSFIGYIVDGMMTSVAQVREVLCTGSLTG